MVDANVAWRVVDNEAVLLHADTSAYFGLNQIGTLLWTRLAEHPMTLDQLTTWARSWFPDAPATLPGEIAAFIDQLVEPNLIDSTDAADAAAPTAAAGTAPAGGKPSWEAPTVQRFGELEKLILSGE